MKIIGIFILISFFGFSCKNNSAKTKNDLDKSKISIKDTSDLAGKDSLKIDENSYASAKEYLDSLFNVKKDSASFIEQKLIEDEDGKKINRVLLIGNLFSRLNKYALFLYRSNDSTLNCKVLKFQDTFWTKVFEENIFSTTTEEEELIHINDLNGDKIPDLVITKDYSDQAIHFSEVADAWLFKNDSFTKINGFDSLYNPEYDSTTNEVYSYQSMGCADLSKYFAEYKIRDNKAVFLKEVSCDCCYSDDSCEITINQRKPFVVSRKKAYKYAPGFYKEMFKSELEEANK